jgi:hypothetical protein
MSKAVGWALIVSFVVLLGTHPGTIIDLLHNFLSVLQRAGDELSSFVKML